MFLRHFLGINCTPWYTLQQEQADEVAAILEEALPSLGIRPFQSPRGQQQQARPGAAPRLSKHASIMRKSKPVQSARDMLETAEQAKIGRNLLHFGDYLLLLLLSFKTVLYKDKTLSVGQFLKEGFAGYYIIIYIFQHI